MDRRLRAVTGSLIVVATVLSGCASTRSAQMGTLANEDKLVSLVVSENRRTVEEECRGAVALGPILGCQITRATKTPEGRDVRTVKIVRFTDSLPSAMAFEIDLHELCHAVASVQTIKDPCHAENAGRVQSAPTTVLRLP